MRIFVTLAIFFTLFACNDSPGPIADNRVNDYALADASGDFHRFSRYNDSKAIVLFVQGNGCPIVRNLLSDFHQIVEDYDSLGFQFFMLNSNPQDSRTTVAKEAASFGFKVPVLVDSGQLLADVFDLRITAEVLVLHPTTRKVLYRGPINNRLDYEAQQNVPSERYLRETLDLILQDKIPETRREVTRGCTITRLSDIAIEVTYTDDIAPVLTEFCVRCHNEYGIAPWSMTDYQTVSGWSAMIKQVLLSKRMPPWKADTEISGFTNDFHLPDSLRSKIIRWIDTGMAYGTGIDTLKTLEHLPPDWQNGTPDKTVTLQQEKIPATGVIPYRYQQFELDLSEDTWIKGIEIKPGNSKVVHHILLTLKNNDRKKMIVDRKPWNYIDDFIALGGIADELTLYPDSTGVLLKNQDTLVVQIHYTPTGKKEVDQTEIGFYYHETVPAKEFYALSPANITFKIPAHGKNVQISARDTINQDITIHYMAPHMHYRGKSIKMTAILPGGEEKVMVSVPDYNFNWQYFYKLKEPISLPAGSVIAVDGIFDNSFQNPLNPDPNKDVTFGIQSTDEMLIGFLNYTLD